MISLVVGNPKPRSRTWHAGHRLVAALGHRLDHAVDLADLGPELLVHGSDRVAEEVARIADSRLVVVASPTYKATYTGLLKLFLERFDTDTGLAGVVAVPLMLGGSPAHQLAPELLLKPVLSEIGASCPTSALYLLDSAGDDDPTLAAWVRRWGSALPDPR